jgi:membrane associated rhomboid family serine protease
MFEDFKNAFQRYNNGHVQLIIINIIVFVVMGIFKVFTLFGAPDIYGVLYDFLSIPAAIGNFIKEPWTIITYAFLHGGVGHIFSNLLIFYWFGRLFVEYLGSDKLIAVYFLGAIAGGLFYLLAYNTIPYFENHAHLATMVGASAAVDAVVVAAATLLPDYTFYLLFIGPVRIKYIAAFSIVVSFLSIAGDNPGGNIAHLGGALIGFIYIKQLQSGSNWGAWITATIDWFKGLFQPRPKVKVTYRSENPRKKTQTKSSSVSQEELDAILDKISDGGYESLTKEEKEKLFNASKKQ